MEHDEVILARLKDALDYTRKTNELVGFFSFTMAIACVSTENPRFYATLCLCFVLVAWGSLLATYTRRLYVLRVVGHPDAKPKAVLKRSIIAVFGIVVLWVVSIGFLDKYGVRKNPLTDPLPILQLRTPNP
jgi:hypothetical protein